AIICGVMSAMRSDPELAELVRTQVLDKKKGEFNGIIERAVRRGELPEGGSAALVEEVISALLINRLAIQGLSIDKEFGIHVVDDVVLPLLHP
ncbi:MAG TPA: TetR-like C-terminal domain-containing protein, partial [Acidimicrobiales bacterium]